MCGIFGYVGSNKAADLTIEGLKNLEYRGYDSWGIAVMNNDLRVNYIRQVGAIGDVKIDLVGDLNGGIGVGHSRWATHGRVNDINTHPHRSQDENVFVVHNGIIDNYLDLKNILVEKGYVFRSETDTEVIAHLIQDNLELYEDIEKAIQASVSLLRGRFAFVVMIQGENSLYAVRSGAPLILGLGEGEWFIASDVPAFLKYTNRVIYMNDGEMLKLDSSSYEFKELENLKVLEKEVTVMELVNEDYELGEFQHFMLKEIYEQKESIRRSINQSDEELHVLSELIRKSDSIFFVGCGTAGKVGLAATYLFSNIAKKQVNFEFASEFNRCKNFLNESSLVIAISQSGETADTIEALEIAKSKGAKTAAIVNVAQSTIDRMADKTLHIKVGPEKAVASTKATTAQLALIILLAFVADERLEYGKKVLSEVCSHISDMFDDSYLMLLEDLAEKIYMSESMYIIGKSVNYPIALESAIKLQEVSYIHAEGFAGGELKHGPLALIAKDVPVIVLAPTDNSYTDIISNATEVKTRGGFVVGVSPLDHEVFDVWVPVPEVKKDSFTTVLVNLIPMQLLSYYLALFKGNNPDKPRNLAKSVTVK